MIKTILQACSDGIPEGKRYVMATVVMATGSSYRGTGARLLIDEDLKTIGEVSGGCLDEDVMNQAKLVFANQQPILRVYDTRDNASNKTVIDGMGPGLGCTGLTKVLLEPLGTADLPMINQLLALVSERTPFLMATAFDGVADAAPVQGTMGAIGSGANFGAGRKYPSDLEDKLNTSKLADVALRKGNAYLYLTADMASRTVLLERVEPQQELLIAGTGDDVLPVLQFAEILGWHCTVADHRPERFEKPQFSGSTNIVLDDYKNILNIARPDRYTFVLIMTHNYQHDMDALEACLAASLGYVGLLGPKEKSARMFEDLAARGIVPGAEFTAVFHSPIGLDIGGETSQEVALSILAELQAKRKSRSGGMLRDSHKPIHDR